MVSTRQIAAEGAAKKGRKKLCEQRDIENNMQKNKNCENYFSNNNLKYHTKVIKQ